MDDEEKREYCFKVLVVGDCGVGKTTLINQYTKGFFYPYYKITIGADFALKVIEYDKKTKMTIQLWDIAGQEHSTTLSRAYYRHANAALLVFDVTKIETLKSVTTWIDAIQDALHLTTDLNFPIVLLANKDDLEWDKRLSTEFLDNLCNNNNTLHSWFPTTAKTNGSIDDAVLAIVQLLLETNDCSKQEIVSITCKCKSPRMQYGGIIHLTGSCDKNDSHQVSSCYGCVNIAS